MKIIMSYIFVVSVIITLIPALTNLTFTKDTNDLINTNDTIQSNYSGEYIRYLNPTGTLELISFEEYIISVVSTEMPASFELEALKAQAVAARTYGIKHIDFDKTYTDLNSIGQAYTSIPALKERWGENYNTYYSKIKSAVEETADEAIFFNDEPIEAVYHSTSGGKTETAGNVWNNDLPYLKSVDSNFDDASPVFLDTVTFTNEELATKFKTEFGDILSSDSNLSSQIAITEHTQAGYVKAVSVGNKTLSGAKLRQLLGLRSAMFNIEATGDSITFTTKGYGHGAGMSQYGANYLAGDGYSYKEILTYYYTNVEILKY